MRTPDRKGILVYGSYGYTGKLIVEECVKQRLDVILSGRNEAALKQQSVETKYPYEAADLSDKTKLNTLLNQVKLVVHCAGPFCYTGKTMAMACLETQTHYTDITGEYEVFEELAALDSQAKEKQIVMMPGVGFDVVPSDCLALFLKNELPSATQLQLAFAMSQGGLSRGTSKTMVESLGKGSIIRRNGNLQTIPLGEKVMSVDFGAFIADTICIPWGDVATAWRSTGISNIEVYSAVPKSTLRMARLSRYFNFLLRQRWIKNQMLKRIQQKPAGPDEQRREKSRSYLWGRVKNTNGDSVTAVMETLNGYSLTAKTAVLIASRIINETAKPGFFTPAQYFGADLIMTVESTIRKRVN